MKRKEIVIDIETGRAPADVLNRMVNEIEPPPSTTKKGKTAIEKYKEDALAKIEDKAFLLDMSPITCIGLMVDGQVTILTTIHAEQVENVPIQVFGLEAEMLAAFKLIVETFDAEESIIITFNGKSFDLPRLRCRMGFYGIKIPTFLREAEHFDVMREFCYHFSVENQRYISLDKCSRLFGLSGKKLKWEEAQDMLDAGNYTEYLLYNVLDLTLTCQCYQKMV